MTSFATRLPNPTPFAEASWFADRVSALLFVAYAAWVAFATALNAAIAMLN